MSNEKINMDDLIDNLPRNEEAPKKTRGKNKVKSKEEIKVNTEIEIGKQIEEEANNPQRTINRAFAKGLAERLLNGKFVLAIKQDNLVRCILEHMDTSENIAMYNRNQLIADLISMVKNGKAEASKILIDMLGFNAASEKYVMNRINFGDLNEKEDDV